jgi:hypothetical protein
MTHAVSHWPVPHHRASGFPCIPGDPRFTVCAVVDDASAGPGRVTIENPAAAASSHS